MILDGELLERYAKQEDQAAFAELVRRHLDGVFAAALRRVGGDTHLAEDVAQQVFVALARQAGRLAGHPVLTGWLYVTTRNQAVMTVRAEHRRKLREAEANLMNEQNSDPSTPQDWGRIGPAIDSAIEQLSEADRTAVLLRYIARKPFEEIGATLKVSADAARMRVDRATEKLRVVLARKGIVSTAALLSAELTRNAALAAPATLNASVTAAALSTTPLAAGAFATAVQFMSTSKITATAASALLVVAVAGVGAHQWAEADAAEREVVEVTKASEQLRAEIERSEYRAQTLNTELAKQQADADAAAKTVAQSARSRAASVVPPKSNPEEVGKEFLKRHPEAKEALSAWLKSAEDENYGELFATLHLTPEQLEKFRALLRENNWFGRSLGNDGLWANFSLGTGKDWQTIQTEMQALIGPEGMRQYGEILMLQNPRQLVTTAAADLVFTSDPMTPRQADDLTASVKANTTLTQDGPLIDWNSVEADAAVILSPAQMRSVTHIRTVDEANVASRKLSSPAPKTLPNPKSS